MPAGLPHAALALALLAVLACSTASVQPGTAPAATADASADGISAEATDAIAAGADHATLPDAPAAEASNDGSSAPASDTTPDGSAKPDVDIATTVDAADAADAADTAVSPAALANVKCDGATYTLVLAPGHNLVAIETTNKNVIANALANGLIFESTVLVDNKGVDFIGLKHTVKSTSGSSSTGTGSVSSGATLTLNDAAFAKSNELSTAVQAAGSPYTFAVYYMDFSGNGDTVTVTCTVD